MQVTKTTTTEVDFIWNRKTGQTGLTGSIVDL